ncbi:MAG TPA: tetraacyldisaccharide 4'-kinase [Gemmatimonadales bacterium]|nr:tetraacyldisaccharide 4'-kinase [Gemmatimonadales bacterium]
MSISLTHRAARWLWASRAPTARLARVALLPLAVVYAAAIEARLLAYRWGLVAVHRLPLPAVGVGNLSVGGAGKTPVAAWVAQEIARAGLKPGILLRGYGADEVLVHQRLVPDAIVVANPDRVAGAAVAREQGAAALVLDDAFQRLDVGRDLNLALVAAEQARLPHWPLPAGPWRERWGALRRADAILVTRKRVGAEEARRLAEQLTVDWAPRPVAVAHLALTGFTGMRSGDTHPGEVLRGRRALAVAGVADPESFGVQVRATGASVRLAGFPDHHPYDPTDVGRLVREAAGAAADYVVVTEKDAVKLRALWPSEAAEPLVARQALRWEWNGDAITSALARLLSTARTPSNHT